MADANGNPNNCDTCDHKKNPDGGHCYMFKDSPTEVCMQHTGRKKLGVFPGLSTRGLAGAIAAAILAPEHATQYEPVVLRTHPEDE